MKNFILLLMLLSATNMSAQSILKGDMTDDNELSIVDVTRVVDVILGKKPKEYISLSSYAYMVDNSMVVGTWYAPNGSSFTLNEDGTTNYSGAATYKFRPYQGTLIFYDDSEKAVKTILVNEIGSDYLLSVNYITDSNFYYTKVKQNINPELYVDLGLPSGTLWATCNIGAKNPEDVGNYFAWGETTGLNDGKLFFAWSSYKWCMGSDKTMTKYCSKNNYGNDNYTDELIDLELSDDAAFINCGPDWRIPSKQQFEELINSNFTTKVHTTLNGVVGLLITSKSDTSKSIFLPAGSSYRNRELSTGRSGFYWTRTLDDESPQKAIVFSFNNPSTIYVNSCVYGRYEGLNIRPVYVPE